MTRTFSPPFLFFLLYELNLPLFQAFGYSILITTDVVIPERNSYDSQVCNPTILQKILWHYHLRIYIFFLNVQTVPNWFLVFQCIWIQYLFIFSKQDVCHQLTIRSRVFPKPTCRFVHCIIILIVFQGPYKEKFHILIQKEKNDVFSNRQDRNR